MVFKWLIEKYQMAKYPIKYARKIGVKVGEQCHFVTAPNWGSEPWLISIGNHVELSGYVTFIPHDGSTWELRDQEKYKKVIRYGKIVIHDNCFIGMGTTVLPGVDIGENSIIGAGSMVTKSIPANSVYAGNPAHFICSVEEFMDKCLKSTPQYDEREYKNNKKQVVLKLLENRMRM